MAEADKIEYRERPILMSAPMVRGTLRDINPKTQTRRIVKWQEEWHPDTHRVQIIECGDCIAAMPLDCYGRMLGEAIKCPYGKPGDRLWVKETWRAPKSLDRLSPTAIGEKAIDAGYAKPWAPIQYEADEVRRDWNRIDWPEPGKTRVSIHMPRWASRITLEIVNIRVERLQDISEADALAEGVYDGTPCMCSPNDYIDFVRSCGNCGNRLVDLCGLYRSLWESLNGPGSWDLNPFVWCISFNRLEAA